MIFIAYPLVKFSELITRLISKKEKAHSINREEIAMLANLGKEEGVFEEHESNVIYNIIMLKTIKVQKVMTPRTVIVAADENMNLEEFYSKPEFLSFSRIPVYDGNIDQITGYVLKDTVLSKLAEDNHSMKLSELKRPVVISYENLTLPSLFEQFLLKKEHIAMVVDDYGGIRGLITMEDIIETLLGLEIVDESDTNEDMQELAKNRWQKIKNSRRTKPN
jgi:CBS domain containing-hemolysin-like protein